VESACLAGTADFDPAGPPGGLGRAAAAVRAPADGDAPDDLDGQRADLLVRLIR
jgi:hypothetical protein